jgi:hypothetical protein
MKKIIILLLIAVSFIACNKEGCTDPTATNYNAEASADDGSCTVEGCTDPNAVNYDSNATVSTECIYNQLGSWTTTKEEQEISILLIMSGDTIQDTSYTETTPLDSLELTGIDILANGSVIEYYMDGEIDSTTTWTLLNNSINLIFNDGTSSDTLNLNIDSVTSDFMRLSSSDSEMDNSTPGFTYDYSFNLTWEFSRN